MQMEIYLKQNYTPQIIKSLGPVFKGCFSIFQLNMQFGAK